MSLLNATREKIIRQAFQLSKVKAPEEDITDVEMNDAAFNLNSMLQGWNNDGFRLFKLKDGYMPLIPHKKEYAMATEAYKTLEEIKIKTFDRIGPNRIKLQSLEGVAIGMQFISVNNTISSKVSISGIDWDNKIVTLSEPLSQSVLNGDQIFFGFFEGARTPMLDYTDSFNSLPITDYESQPNVGDQIMFSFNNTWERAMVTSVDAQGKRVYFTPEFLPGTITGERVIYGTSVAKTNAVDDAKFGLRQITLESALTSVPKTIALKSKDGLGQHLPVQSTTADGTKIILFDCVSELTNFSYGQPFVDSRKRHSLGKTIRLSDFTNYVSELEQCEITDYARNEFREFVKITRNVMPMNYSYLYMRETGSSTWVKIDLSSQEIHSFKLYEIDDKVYLADKDKGLFSLEFATIDSITTGLAGVEYIITFRGVHYLFSSLDNESMKRQVCSSADMVVYDAPWTAIVADLRNAAEFLDKMYLGHLTTTVTPDMKLFSHVPVYSENRSVVGKKMVNINSSQLCSFTEDGVNFEQIPFFISHQSSWGYKDGCSFVSMYDMPVPYQPLCSQIFLTNTFFPDWKNQDVVQGKVFKMNFYKSSAVFISDKEIKEMNLTVDVSANCDMTAYCFGEQIGRPHELWSVVKYAFNSASQLPMNPVVIRDYADLPHINVSGDPTQYCFFREARDARFMVWGTPNKFGEYLKFMYVEPISLLDSTNAVPDFPDEYFGCVVDGLAVELAHYYGAPPARIQELTQRAEMSKETALLHDNEPGAYQITPDPRMIR